MPLFPLRILTALAVLSTLAGCAEKEAARTAAPQGANAAAPLVLVVPGVATPPVAAQPVFAAPGGKAARPGRLTAGEVSTLVSDNTISGTSPTGQVYYSYFERNGVLRFRQGSLSDKGVWRVTSDGALCATVTAINNGAEECFTLYRESNTVRFEKPDGNPAGNFSVLLGNPQSI